MVTNIEERALKAQEFLNGFKEPIFADERFSRVFTYNGNLQGDIEKNISSLNTTLKIYKDAKEMVDLFPIDPYSKGQYAGATLGLENALLKYEKFCISTLLPIFKKGLIELSDKVNSGNIRPDQAASIEPAIEKPPSEYRIKPDVSIPINPLGDRRVNAINEKINRALEWIEIPLKIGKKAGDFLAEHGSIIVSAVSGVLKLLTIL